MSRAERYSCLFIPVILRMMMHLSILELTCLEGYYPGIHFLAILRPWAQEKDKIKIKYAKEFFINEKGEVIKMAAIISKDVEVITALGSDRQLKKEIEAFRMSTSKDKEEKKKSKMQMTREPTKKKKKAK